MATNRTRAESSQASQALIAAAAARLAARGWGDVDLHDLRGSLPRLRLVVASAVRRYAPAAITDAMRFYRRERSAAGVPGSPRFDLPRPAQLEQIGKSVNWAAEPLWGESDLPAAERRLEAVVERLVLNAGREAIVTAVSQDREAKAWARIPEPDACYFCAMLSTRGAIYKSEETAGREANSQFIGEGDFKFHDHCRCHAIPVFTHYRLTPEIARWTAQWDRLRRENGGSLTLDRWREAFDSGFASEPAAEQAAS